MKIFVCQNLTCSSLDGTHLLRDIEELAQGRCDVEEWQEARYKPGGAICLDVCAKGPNVEVQLKSGETKIVEGVKTWEKACQLVEDVSQVKLNDRVKKLGKMKYDIRREKDPEVRLEKLKKAFKALGDDTAAANSEPGLLSELLVLRSRQLLSTQPADALSDAQRACDLAPNWAQAKLVLADALAALGRAAAGVSALEDAFAIGKCINRNTMQRRKKKLERQAKTEAASKQESASPDPLCTQKPVILAQEDSKVKHDIEKDVVMEEEEPTSMVESEIELEKLPGQTLGLTIDFSNGKTLKIAGINKGGVADLWNQKFPDKMMETGDEIVEVNGEGRGDRKELMERLKWDDKLRLMLQKKEQGNKVHDGEGSDCHPARAEARDPSDFVEWRVDSVTKMNHNCINLRLTSMALSITSRDPDPGGIWHVGFLIEDKLGQEVKRAYTPVSHFDAYRKGHLEFMVKVYPDGQMSRYLAKLHAGNELLVSPPIVTDSVEGCQDLAIVAGGSAVTVAMQICEAALRQNAGDKSVNLFLCNRDVEDVLFQEFFEEWLRRHPSFQLVHCISGNMPSQHLRSGSRAVWRYGRFSAALIAECISRPNVRGIVSGPPGLCKAAADIWKSFGKKRDDIHILDEEGSEVEPTPQPVLDMHRFLCSLWRPFCSQDGKRADQDDDEAIPAIRSQSN